MERDTKLEKNLLNELSSFNPAINWEKEAYKLETTSNNKRAVVVWPYPLMEVFFDFWEGENKILSESLEFYENETNEDLIQYLVEIHNDFFKNETRLETTGKLLKRTELQCNKGGKWVSVF